jgi:hypothetical protein
MHTLHETIKVNRDVNSDRYLLWFHSHYCNHEVDDDWLNEQQSVSLKEHDNLQEISLNALTEVNVHAPRAFLSMHRSLHKSSVSKLDSSNDWDMTCNSYRNNTKVKAKQNKINLDLWSFCQWRIFIEIQSITVDFSLVIKVWWNLLSLWWVEISNRFLGQTKNCFVSI